MFLCEGRLLQHVYQDIRRLWVSEAAVGVRTPFEGIRLFVSSCIPDCSGPSLLVPGPWATEVSPSGNVFIIPCTTCWLGETLRNDTSKSSALLGEEAAGGVSLSIISGRRSPEEEDC